MVQARAAHHCPRSCQLAAGPQTPGPRTLPDGAKPATRRADTISFMRNKPKSPNSTCRDRRGERRSKGMLSPPPHHLQQMPQRGSPKERVSSQPASAASPQSAGIGLPENCPCPLSPQPRQQTGSSPTHPNAAGVLRHVNLLGCSPLLLVGDGRRLANQRDVPVGDALQGQRLRRCDGHPRWPAAAGNEACSPPSEGALQAGEGRRRTLNGSAITVNEQRPSFLMSAVWGLMVEKANTGRPCRAAEHEGPARERRAGELGLAGKPCSSLGRSQASQQWGNPFRLPCMLPKAWPDC